MAFILPTEQSSGVLAEYWKIMTVFVDCGLPRPASRTYLSLYLNQQARLDGKSPVSGTEVIMFLDEIDSTFSYDFRACIYNALKQRPEWANAVDALDDPTLNEEYRLKTGGKNKNKPIQDYNERLIQIDGCKYVDYIVKYESEDELYNIIKEIIKKSLFTERQIEIILNQKNPEISNHYL